MAQSASGVYAQAATALKKELGNVKYRRQKPERAFIDWYVLARYGENAKCEIVDGPGDGGVDALVTEGMTKVVLQSKYEPSIRLRSVGGKELAEFERVAERLAGRTSADDFEEWLGEVRAERRQKYRAVRRLSLKDPLAVRFDFVTSKRVTIEVAEVLHVVDIERVAALWYLYEEGFTPPVESVEVEFEDLWGAGSASERYRNYVGLADVRVFMSLMDNDEHERLFAQNVRTDLRTRINARIRESYEKEPDKFWLGNNGLYAVCSRAEQRGKTLKMIYPSIINGSQTLHALHASRRRHRCRILVRVLEMDVMGERELLSAIVRRTNTQNPMRAMNLAAHDSEQLQVARFLDGLSIFYERREREWKNEKQSLLTDYIAVGMKDVAQWLAVTGRVTGIGTARSKVGVLFVGNEYRKLFGVFGVDFTVAAYHRLARALFAGMVVKRAIRYLPQSLRSRARIAGLLLVRAVDDALRQSPALDEQLVELLRERYQGPAGASRAVRRIIQRILRGIGVAQRRALREDSAMDWSNYFKRDDTTEHAYNTVVGRPQVKLLAKALEKAVLV